MEETLRKLVAKIAETNVPFPPTAHLRDDLKVDSVRVFELVFEIEQAFAISFPEERYGEVQTFNDLMQIVNSLQAAQNGLGQGAAALAEVTVS
jgi:acyl carrier protein